MAGATRPSGSGEASGIHLVEEAMHLLRSAPVAAWVIYLSGAGVWVLGFLFFWAYTTWFAPGEAELVGLSLLLVGLFAWLKAAQADFCQRLLAHRLGAAAPRWSAARLAHLAVEQLRVQAAGLLVVPMGLVLTVPAAWVVAFYQSCSVLREEGGVPLRAQAWREATRWPRQNHFGLVCLSVLAMAVWVNVAGAFYLVPYLANRFLGLDNVFGINGWFLLNPTFLAFVTALSWLCVDPLLKAFYVLRVFYGRAQETGEDLVVELRPLLRPRAVAVLALLALLAGGDGQDARAETGVSVERAQPAPEATVDPAALDRSIAHALEGRDFQWRLRPRARGELADERETGPVRSFVRSSIELVREVLRWVAELVERVSSWVRDLFSSGERAPRAAGTEGVSVIRALVYVLLAGVVGLLAWMLLGMYRQRGPRATPVQAQPVAAAAPDLNDETLHAGTLPADEWLRLAAEQISCGEWRLALRALYLASLARLASGGRLSLAKAKTNLDYEGELRRRSPGDEALHARFRARRREFERVWYGRTEAEPQDVRAWFDDLQGGAAL